MQDEATMSFRLSPQQELVWSSQPDGPAGGAQATLDVAGPVDGERLRAALARVVARHEILRTTFQRRSGMKTPLQVVRAELEPAWSDDDLRALDGAAQERGLTEVAAAERLRKWDYEDGPLVRVRLAALADDRHVLVLTIATPCADAGSMAVVAAELAAHYAGRAVEEDPLQYADFAEWQQQLVSGETEDDAAGRAFWADASPASATSLPFLQTAPAAASEDFDVPVSSSTLAAIASAAEKYGVAPEAIVQAAWHATIAKLSGEDEVTIGFVPPSRLHEELTTAVGAFARPLPISSGPVGATVAELAVAIQHASELAERWQDTAPLDAAGAPIGFVSVGRSASVGADDVEFAWHRIEAAPFFPLELEWDGAGCRLRAQPAAFDRVSASRTARYVGRVLAAAAAVPETIFDDLELLDESDVRRLTEEVNQTATELPAATVAELVTAVAASSPERTAVVDESGSISYAELDRRANALAHRLRRNGVKPGSVVGLCTDRTTEMIVALLGILKAGAAYLPLNFEHPEARLAHQLVETGASAVVTQEALLHRLPSFEGDVVCIDRDRAELDREPETAPDGAASPDDLVYVIYTSGSTGTPKGVGVTNANLSNYVQAIGRRIGADAMPLTFAMVSAISTDLGNTAVFPALCHGGTLVLVSPAAAADGAAASAFLQAHSVDVLKITPSHLNALLVGADAAGVLPRRWLVVGGEALSWDLVARVRELGECRILNHFGPTETTIGSCTFALEADRSEPAATVPIGSPIANTSCYVLDEKGRCVAEGVPGDLFIAGAGVARGYVGRSDLTDERFRPDPFGGDRMYATGDLVRRLPSGELEFLGRRDDQIKIRGFRVEPGEIEGVLRAFDSVGQAVVIARGDGRGERRLVAYVTLSSQATADDLRGHLADVMPDYMIPSAFVVLESLPLTPSGKIDRLALPDPERVSAAADAAAHVPPRTPVEESVAAIWADVLGLERIGVEDDFFALGGHSLLATQIVAQVRSDFSINLPLHALFTSPTVATLSQQIVELLGHAPDADTEKLLAELEGLSDEEVGQLLTAETPETPTQ